MPVTIEKNVPMPRSDFDREKELVEAIRRMDVGDSVRVPRHWGGVVWSLEINRVLFPKQFEIRCVEIRPAGWLRAAVHGWRLWRVA